LRDFDSPARSTDSALGPLSFLTAAEGCLEGLLPSLVFCPAMAFGPVGGDVSFMDIATQSDTRQKAVSVWGYTTTDCNGICSQLDDTATDPSSLGAQDARNIWEIVTVKNKGKR